MLENWEVFAGLLLFFLFLFPLRQILLRNYQTLIGAFVGIVIGRILYVWVCMILGFQFWPLKIIMMLLGANAGAKIARDFFNNIVPGENRDVGRRQNNRRN